MTSLQSNLNISRTRFQDWVDAGLGKCLCFLCWKVKHISRVRARWFKSSFHLEDCTCTRTPGQWEAGEKRGTTARKRHITLKRWTLAAARRYRHGRERRRLCLSLNLPEYCSWGVLFSSVTAGLVGACREVPRWINSSATQKTERV